MRCRCYKYTEMAGVGVWPHICCAQEAAAVMLQQQATRVVIKLASIHTIRVGATLVDEAVDDAIEGGALNGHRIGTLNLAVQRLARRHADG